MFCLTRNGPSETSEAFADRLATWKTDGRDVALVVGGAFGLDDGLREEAEATLGLSPMTLPHELARAVLLEQLYRADTILRGEPYHKGRG
jgi:23S rRNA (pseudouridine1915-N3)-methyltransferase